VIVRATALAVLGLLAALPGGTVRAQDPPHDGAAGPPATLWSVLSDSSRAGWLRPAASFIVPGTGQLLAGSDRGALYLVAEVFLVARFVSLEHDAQRQAGRYRDLAFSVARGAFAPQTRDTVWGYYEAMGKYIESGPFSDSTGTGATLAPPTDTSTFNGHIWQLARETFFANPDSTPDPGSTAYQAALAFYGRRAVGPNFRWSWRGAAIEQDLYRQTIASSDGGFRQARQQLGLLLANHLLSAIDALVSNRLSQRHRGVGLRSHLQQSPTLPGRPLQLTLQFRATF
jgi:hypothetical protein